MINDEYADALCDLADFYKIASTRTKTVAVEVPTAFEARLAEETVIKWDCPALLKEEI